MQTGYYLSVDRAPVRMKHIGPLFRQGVVDVSQVLLTIAQQEPGCKIVA